MKFKLTAIIEAKDLPDFPGYVEVTKGLQGYKHGEWWKIEQLKENGLTPVDCNALNLMDPDRTERLCPSIIG